MPQSDYSYSFDPVDTYGAVANLFELDPDEVLKKTYQDQGIGHEESYFYARVSDLINNTVFIILGSVIYIYLCLHCKTQRGIYQPSQLS